MIATDLKKPESFNKECDLEVPFETNFNEYGKLKSNKFKILTKEGQTIKKFDPFDRFDLEPQGTWMPTPIPTPTPLPSEPPEPIILGPFPRLFVIQDGGYGYEILAEEMYQIYEIAKFYNKNCTRKDDKCVINDENCIVHTFVTIENKSKITLDELLKDEEKTQTSFPISPWLLTRKVSQFAQRFQAKQRNNKLQTQTKCNWLQLEFMLPNLPHIINPVVPKLDLEIEKLTFLFRQILETPMILEETYINIEKILEVYANWMLENIDLPGCDIGPDTRSDCEIQIEKFIARCKQEVTSLIQIKLSNFPKIIQVDMILFKDIILRYFKLST